MLELQDHQEAYFVTLTYDDNHLKFGADAETGEMTLPTLCKRDTQLFFKELRNKGQKVRFFGCGEYGSQTYRPHYHFIIFGLHLDDLKPYKLVTIGNEKFQYYNSAFLDSCWLDYDLPKNSEYYGKPRGYIVVGAVSWQSCAYVARYVTKKITGDAAQDVYDSVGLERPFTNMSRKPGIARNYFNENGVAIFNSAYINVATEKGGVKFRPPSYYVKLFDSIDPLGCAAYKDKMKKYATELNKIRLSKTDKSLSELLADDERRALKKSEKLIRSEI